MLKDELRDLGQAIKHLPLQLAGMLISLLTVTLTDIEMMTLVGGAVALGFLTSPLVALATVLFVYGILRTSAQVINRHTEQINFLARVIRDRDNLVRIRNVEDDA